MRKKSEGLKDYRDIGDVAFPIEQLMAARSSSSCCVGQEAMLESDRVPVKQWIADDWKPTGAA